MNIPAVSLGKFEAQLFREYALTVAENDFALGLSQVKEKLLKLHHELADLDSLAQAAQLRKERGAVLLRGIDFGDWSLDLKGTEQEEIAVQCQGYATGVYAALTAWSLLSGCHHFQWEHHPLFFSIRGVVSLADKVCAMSGDDLPIHIDAAQSPLPPSSIELLCVQVDSELNQYTGLIEPSINALSSQSRSILAEPRFYLSQYGQFLRYSVIERVAENCYHHRIAHTTQAVDAAASKALEDYWDCVADSPKTEVLLKPGDLFSFDQRRFLHFRRISTKARSMEAICRRLLIKAYGLDSSIIARAREQGLIKSPGDLILSPKFKPAMGDLIPSRESNRWAGASST